MSSRRTAIIFIAAFIAIAGSAWLSSRRHLDRSIMSGELVLPTLKSDINALTDVHLTRSGGIATTLHKGRDGWEVKEREYPADSSKVRKLLLDLSALQVVEEKTSDPANYAAIGVEDVTAPNAGSTRIDLIPGKGIGQDSDKDGGQNAGQNAGKDAGAGKDTALSILIGKPSGAKSGFVRIVKDKRSLLATPYPTTDAEPAQWIDKSLFSLPPARIKQVSFSGSEGAYTISRDKAEQTNFTVTGLPRGRKLSSESAGNASASGLELLTIDDVRKAGAGDAATAGAGASAGAAAAPAATAPANAAHATFTTFDGLVVEATGHAEGERRFVSFAAKSTTPSQEHEARTLLSRFAGREFEIPTYKYDGIFRPLEELLEKAPEPKATKAASKASGKSPASPGPNQ